MKSKRPGKSLVTFEELAEGLKKAGFKEYIKGLPWFLAKDFGDFIYVITPIKQGGSPVVGARAMVGAEKYSHFQVSKAMTAIQGDPQLRLPVTILGMQ